MRAPLSRGTAQSVACSVGVAAYAKRDVEEGEEEVPKKAINKQKGKELAHQARLELGRSPVIFPVVQDGGEPMEDMPVEELDEQPPRSRDEHHKQSLGRLV